MESKHRGFGAIQNSHDPYSFYNGRWVEINPQNETCWGKYEGVKDGHAVLRPYVRVEHYPTNEKKETNHRFVLVDEPKFIALSIINTLNSIREEYVMAHICDKRIIIPQRG